MKSMSMYSTQYCLGSFCLNYCSNAAWHGVDQSVHCSGVSRAQVALIVAFSFFCWVWHIRFFLLLFTIPHEIFIGDRSGECWPIKDRSMVLKPGTGSFGTVCRCQVLLENEICISIVGQQQEAEVL